MQLHHFLSFPQNRLAEIDAKQLCPLFTIIVTFLKPLFTTEIILKYIVIGNLNLLFDPPQHLQELQHK